MTMTSIHPVYGFTTCPRPSAAVVGKHAAPLPCHSHFPYLHRDGLVGWCNWCGLDADGREPLDLFSAYSNVEGDTGCHHGSEYDTVEFPAITLDNEYREHCPECGTESDVFGIQFHTEGCNL